jgi:hypothetical protein
MRCMSKEKDRRRVALLLLGVIAAVVCGALVLIGIGVEAAAVKEIVGVVFPPLLTLSGSAVGYYFGQK